MHYLSSVAALGISAEVVAVVEGEKGECDWMDRYFLAFN